MGTTKKLSGPESAPDLIADVTAGIKQLDADKGSCFNEQAVERVKRAGRTKLLAINSAENKNRSWQKS